MTGITATNRANDYSRYVTARMIDFFTVDGMPWPRRLWDVGSILALEELWESGFWQARRVLSPAACDWQRNELRRVIGPDVGLGERDLRREVTTLLNAPLLDPSPARRRLAELIHHARNGTRLLADPRRELEQVAAAFRIGLRRLYRARNIVLHGGSMQGVALRAALRTATPLVGAGLDRLAHAMLTEGLVPLDLAARAEVALNLVDGETGLPITDLLEPRHPTDS